MLLLEAESGLDDNVVEMEGERQSDEQKIYCAAS